MISQSASAAAIGNRMFAFFAVVALHVAAVYGFYSGLLTRMVVHIPTVFQLVPAQPHERPAPEPMPQHVPLLSRATPFVPTPEFSSGEVDTDGWDVVTSRPPIPSTTEVLPTHTHTAASYDPHHPFKVGEEYYPPYAVRLGQEGHCAVQVTVASDGRIVAATLVRGTGFTALDSACLTAVEGQRMRPAIEDGKSVESRVVVPIVWKLTTRQ